MYPVMSNSTINLDPHAHVLYSDDSPDGSRSRSQRGSYSSNPFSDGNSIITTSASTQSTNVIPIALVPHGVSSPTNSSSQQTSDLQSTSGTSERTRSTSSSSSDAPPRPAHSPDLGLRFEPLSHSHGHGNLNLDHVNVSKDSFRAPNVPYASSQASGFSARDSVMTSGSFASDMLYEAPQIVTAAPRAGLAKAEVVSINGSLQNSMTSNNASLRATGAIRQPGRSPLARNSFGPGDVLSVSEKSSTHSRGNSVEGQEIEYRRNPFGDEQTPKTDSSFGRTPVPVPSTASLDMHDRSNPLALKDRDIEVADSPRTPRPASTLTQAASIIGAEIGGATMVRLVGPPSGSLGTASSNRMTSAHLLTPGLSTGMSSASGNGNESPGAGNVLGTGMSTRAAEDRTLQIQQAQALAAARAKAAASGIAPKSSANGNGAHSRCVSEVSCVSTGGDSLLESFTFVPPSPISSRPPRSPLSAQSAAAAVPPVPPLPKEMAQENELNMDEEAVESRRKMLGMSVGTTASNALEGYEFRIENSAPAPSSTTYGKPQTSTEGRVGAKPSLSAVANDGQGLLGKQRASLDTLALTSDLAAFPLNFDANGNGRRA